MSTRRATSVFDPSASIGRASVGPSASVSVADSLPNVNFGFDELRDRMAKFAVRFDAFIEQGRKRVLEERNQFRVSVAELQEDQRMRKKDIEIVQHKSSAHRQTVEKEATEAHEMRTAIAQLSAQRDGHLSQRDGLLKQIESTQRAIDSRVAAQQEHARRQATQARFNVPELDFWTSTLCLTIEGAGRDDRLKFVFTHVDERNWDRSVWFELITASREYEIGRCRPKVDRTSVEQVLERLNESRELVVLLKGMRELFVEAIKAGQ